MLEADRKQFSRALALAGTVVEPRNTIPVLGMLKISANGVLALEANNLDICTRVEMEYEGDEGDFMLPEPARVRAAINAARGDTVLLHPEDKRLGVHCGALVSGLPTVPSEDFPRADRISCEEFAADLGAAELRQIRRVLPAISTEETRYYLCGVCVQKVGDWLYRFIATNGHLLMFVDVPLPNAMGTIPDGTIIPRQWMGIALGQFAKAKDGSKLTFGKIATPNRPESIATMQPSGAPRIAMGGKLDGLSFTLTGKLIDGTYPDVNRVIPTDTPLVVRVKRSDFTQAVHSLSPLTTERTRAIKLAAGTGKLVLTLDSPEVGKSEFKIDAEHNLPSDFAIGFNGGYLMNCVNALRGDEMELRMSDPAAPTMILDPADTEFRAVLMPMRV